MAQPTLEISEPPTETPSAPAGIDGPTTPTEGTDQVDQVPSEQTWAQLVGKKKDADTKNRFAAEATAILQKHGLLESYCCLALMEPEDSINAFDLDEIFQALQSANPEKQKDVLLLLLSHGGVIEPAYQISKLCKLFARRKFVVTVPRQAKSAATLIALGADEIHMGLLGQLGPIDPQLGGLPALGVAQALQRIAALSERFPGSADMFAKYLRQALTVEQIGYCDRIAESAEQYAQRLLATKPALANDASEIAKELVHTYKDHAFVIDLAEAREHLGEGWVRDGTPEILASEEIYSLFTRVNFLLGWLDKKKLLVLGEIGNPSDVFMWANK